MSMRYEFTVAGGVDLEIPGATNEGDWEEPLADWGLILGDPGATALVVEDSLDNIERWLEKALAKVRYRKELEQAGDFINVTVDGHDYTVPRAKYRDGMPAHKVWEIAVSVREGEDC